MAAPDQGWRGLPWGVAGGAFPVRWLEHSSDIGSYWSLPASARLSSPMASSDPMMTKQSVLRLLTVLSDIISKDVIIYAT